MFLILIFFDFVSWNFPSFVIPDFSLSGAPAQTFITPTKIGDNVEQSSFSAPLTYRAIHIHILGRRAARSAGDQTPPGNVKASR